MKNKSVITKGISAGLLVLVLIVGSSWGYISNKQKNTRMCEPGPMQREFLKLDESQNKQVENYRLQMIKQTTPVQNELKVLKAKLHAQSVGEKIDEKSIYKLMEDISALKLKIAKSQFQFQRNFRSVLTEDQKILFDADESHFADKGCGMRMGFGDKPGMGRGFEEGAGCNMRMRDRKSCDRSKMPMPGEMPKTMNEDKE